MGDIKVRVSPFFSPGDFLAKLQQKLFLNSDNLFHCFFCQAITTAIRILCQVVYRLQTQLPAPRSLSSARRNRRVNVLT